VAFGSRIELISAFKKEQHMFETEKDSVRLAAATQAPNDRAQSRANYIKACALGVRHDVPESELGEEFDQLLKMEKVEDIRVDDKEIIVDTGIMFCQDPRTGTVHELGQYQIHIALNQQGWSPDLRFFNKKGPLRCANLGCYTLHAPHVQGEGRPCLGNTSSTFSQLFQTQEYGVAIQVALAFLESVNVDDAWGRNIDRWPEARAVCA
jgi:hypothetical protein